MPKYAANPEPIQRIRTLPNHIAEADEGRGVITCLGRGPGAKWRKGGKRAIPGNEGHKEGHKRTAEARKQ